MLLEVNDIYIAYGDIEAVGGVSFYLEKGEFVSVIGANGAGKTTILNSIMGIHPPQKGAISFKGRDVTAMAAYERARIGIRLVPERSRLFPRLTVYENLLTGVYGLRQKIPVDKRILNLQFRPHAAGRSGADVDIQMS